MRREEIVIRELIREWLITEASEGVGADAAAELSGIGRLADMLDNSLDDAAEKMQDKNESAAVLVLGGLLSMPKLVKWFTAVVSFIVKAYSKMTEGLSSSDSKKSDELARKVSEMGVEFYHKGHHFIEHAFVSLVEAIVVVSAAANGLDSAELAYEWCKGDGKETVKKAAMFMDFAATSILAVYSVKGAIHAIEEIHTAMIGVEGLLSAVKVAHVSEAIITAFGEAAGLISEALADAGISSALVSEMADKIKDVFEELGHIMASAAKKISKEAIAAGIIIALGAGVTNKMDITPRGEETSGQMQ
jgi:hypothetical protein